MPYRIKILVEATSERGPATSWYDSRIEWTSEPMEVTEACDIFSASVSATQDEIGVKARELAREMVDGVEIVTGTEPITRGF